MIKRVALQSAFLLLAFSVLLISVFRVAEVKYDFSMPKGEVEKVLGDNNADVQIDYNLPNPGRVLPDSPAWPIKAVRDRIWLMTTTNDAREAELLLLFADKRLAASKTLFDNGKPEEGFSTLLRAEKYLIQAQEKERENFEMGVDTSEFLHVMALSSLRHRQVIEELLITAPEDAVPKISETINYSKKVYESSMHSLNDQNLPVPKNPFDSQ